MCIKINAAEKLTIESRNELKASESNLKDNETTVLILSYFA